jgi:ABC-2 type transport system permease protein
MSAPANLVPGSPLDAQASAPAIMVRTRPFYWSVRRELWENRSIYIAPLAAAGLGIVAFLIDLRHLPQTVRTLAERDLTDQQVALVMPFSHLALLVLLTAMIVGIFYSLDALYGERRDRSILFWKSLPISDLTIVLSKASIPLLVLPLMVFAITVSLQVIMWLLSAAVLVVNGLAGAAQWTLLLLLQMECVLLYGLIALALWYAPVYGWLLLVSAWARRAPFLWALLPPLAMAAFERIAFHTSHVGRLLMSRLFGFAADAFAFQTPSGERIDPHFIPLTQLTPARFLSDPGLWAGLVVAAVMLAAAVRLRRYREPI